MKYSDVLVEWLAEFGYTHCFYVGGGNIMHLVESCSRKMTCIPTVHEVAAGIAAEYFNQAAGGKRAFALVTAGPGLTNIVTAIAGAWLESHELLVIGGQVKTADLSRGTLRQRGIQEIDGVSIVRSITNHAQLMDSVVDRAKFHEITQKGSSGRHGPVFVEIPLDIQARDVDLGALVQAGSGVPPIKTADASQVEDVASRVRRAKRPVFLFGGGVSRDAARQLASAISSSSVPLMATWNAADRVAHDHPVYFGRPNTWGQRYSNLLLQQSDLLVAFGTRLSLQQSGFNWQEFIPAGDIVQIDCDQSELEKGHPKVELPICADANDFLTRLYAEDLGEHGDWIQYCKTAKSGLPLIEENSTGSGYISPYKFVSKLSDICSEDDVVIPCSSGGAFTVMMQTFAQKNGQIIVTNKGLASMGYGLSGAIGAAIATNRRTILVEGDGGFSQNLQEIGTAAINNLNLKIFIFDDNGYASIRSTQINYFGGRYVGCDIKTGLGLPDWEKVFATYDVPVTRLKDGFETDPTFMSKMESPGVQAFIVPIDPEQTYFPRITSRLVEGGGMVSNPLHKMTPPLTVDQLNAFGSYLPQD